MRVEIFFSGFEALRNADGLFLNQTYEKTRMSEANSTITHLPNGAELFIGDNEPFENPTLYRSIEGLRYSTMTRCDSLNYSGKHIKEFWDT